ncbi:MAG TPA: M14 family zinc carboxypeptidase [Allosphingosinicella sp.]|nr:M14 family zinc carboxypeptidase [Allosphingosinicella sp.]
MYRTVAQIEAEIGLLAAWFPAYFTKIPLPNNSVLGKPISALRMRAGSGPERRGVLLVGGTHARELMNPEAILDMAVDLLLSHINGTDIVYGGQTFTADVVKTILEAVDLWLLPCLNPDGRAHVMTVDDLWRKNRRDNPGTPCDGVDLNRNYDLVFGVTEGQTSCSPCSDVFCGPSAFSEPETKNVKALLDGHSICCFADVHSFSELILHPWGHAPTQTVDATKRFTTLPTGTCAPIGKPGYQEYMEPRDLLRFQTVGDRIVDAIKAVRGRVYTRQPGIALYPTTGTASDYVYSRHIANPKLGKIYAYTFETGPDTGNTADSFHPADPTLIKRDAKAAMLTLAHQCVCAIELIGLKLLGSDTEVSALRTVRDDLLATTAAGRTWIACFERVQHRLLGVVLADESLRKEAASLLERAGSLVKDERAKVSREDVARGRSLLRELTKRDRDRGVRADLKGVDSVISRMAGLSSREAIERLMQQTQG